VRRRSSLLVAVLAGCVGVALGIRPSKAGRYTLSVAGFSVASGFNQTAGRSSQTSGAPSNTLPARLSDQAFWKLITDVSEPDGTFRSDNLVSNEIRFQWVLPELMRTVRPGGVYLGVGPEQNFTYIAALRPKLAFILDVRRGNVDLHLMYKALFELAADRADFVSRLLSRKRPAGLTETSTAAEIFGAFAAEDPNEGFAAETLAAIRNNLVTVHHLPLTGADLERIQAIHHVFLLAGTKIQYSPYGSFGGTVQPTYGDLMAATDEAGQARSFLASEQAFIVVRDLERRNLIVPVVGNFAGPKTLHAIGGYVRRSGARVSMFYVSNVEEYLRQDGVWQTFCGNLASLPIDETSALVRAVRLDPLNPAVEGFATRVSLMATDVRDCTRQ
jgi:hypothetical protein